MYELPISWILWSRQVYPDLSVPTDHNICLTYIVIFYTRCLFSMFRLICRRDGSNQTPYRAGDRLYLRVVNISPNCSSFIFRLSLTKSWSSDSGLKRCLPTMMDFSLSSIWERKSTMYCFIDLSVLHEKFSCFLQNENEIDLNIWSY